MAKSRLKFIRRSLGGETTLEGAIDAMGKEREEQVLERISEFTDEVVVIVKKLQDVVERFAADRYEELEESARELDALESAADDTKEDILDRLSLGGVFPMNRADLSRLVGSMDSIANLSAGAADRIGMRRFTLPPRMNELLVQLAQARCGSCRRSAGCGLRLGHRSAAKPFAWPALSTRWRAAPTTSLRSSTETCSIGIPTYKTFHQVKAILERLESIADRCSQNAELVRHMALEYIEYE